MIVLHLSRMNSLVGKKLEKVSFQKDRKIEASKIDWSGKSLMKIWSNAMGFFCSNFVPWITYSKITSQSLQRNEDIPDWFHDLWSNLKIFFKKNDITVWWCQTVNIHDHKAIPHSMIFVDISRIGYT